MSEDFAGDDVHRLRERALDGDLPADRVAEALRHVAAADPTALRPAPPGSEPTVMPAGGVTPPALPQAPPTGRPFGRYILMEELGHGGMGVVWKAWDTQLRRIVALKGMLGEEFAEASQVERFMREARAAARLSHPNIVPVYDVGEQDGQHYFTTEYIEGLPLDAVMKTQVAVKQALAWVKAIAEGLHYAHEQGIVHRDVKPGNVLIDRDGKPHVMDFGLAKQVEKDGSSGPTLTLSGDLLGTPRYMSPEQTRGAAAAGPASDQFSLGVVMYELLTGKLPFVGAEMRALLNAIAEKDPVPPTRYQARIHRDVETICLKALEKDPARRYASLGDLAADVGRYLDGEPISARPAGALRRLWREARRRKAIAIPIAALFLCLLAVVATWGALAVRGRLRLRAAVSAAEDLLRAGLLDEAQHRAMEAQALAPEDPSVKRLLARVHVAQGRRAVQTYQEAKGKVESLEHETEQEGAIPAGATEEQVDGLRRVRWRREEALEYARKEKGRAWSEAARPFHEALAQVPRDSDARAALAGLYWEEFLRAEALRDRTEEALYRSLVMQYGGEEYAALLRGEKEVLVSFFLPSSFHGERVSAFLYQYVRLQDPPVLYPTPFDPVRREALAAPAMGSWKPVPLAEAKVAGSARVSEVRWGSLYPLATGDRNRLALPVVEDEPPRALLRTVLPRGSYLLYIPPGQGLWETRYPFEVMRERAWDETCELIAEGDPPPPPPGLDSLQPPASARYWVCIPAGPYPASGDHEALQSPPRRAKWTRVPLQGTQAVIMARLKVTTGMWRAYVNDSSWHKGGKEFTRLPRVSPEATEASVYWKRDAAGKYLPKDEYASWWTDDVPIFSISALDAGDYCEWLTARVGGGMWRFALPPEDEWERAARGPDGRFFPWGDSFDPAFCRMMDSRLREPEGQTLSTEPVGLFPLDESPFGVRDLGGGMREWTSTPSGAAGQLTLIMKGGAWSGPVAMCRSASRVEYAITAVYSHGGLRLVARRLR